MHCSLRNVDVNKASTIKAKAKAEADANDWHPCMYVVQLKN